MKKGEKAFGGGLSMRMKPISKRNKHREESMNKVTEKEYPFKFSKEWGGLTPGCEMHTEQYEYSSERYFIAHRMGSIIIEMVTEVEMPGKYINRVIYKKKYNYPDGTKSGWSGLSMMTKPKFRDFLNNPFPAEYELDPIEEPKWFNEIVWMTSVTDKNH